MRNRFLEEAEGHRLAATSSAESLLALFDDDLRAPPPRAATAPYVRRIIDEEEAGSHALGEAAQAMATAAVSHFDRLSTFEFLLLGLVLLVLGLEGLFVVNPAVKKIQRIMDDLRRSHDELKIYRQSSSSLTPSSRTSRRSRRTTCRSRCERSRPSATGCGRDAAARIDDQGRDYLDRIQNAAGRMQTLINDLLTYARVATKATAVRRHRPGLGHP